MRLYIKIILLLVFISQLSFGCDMCNLQTPSIHVSVTKKQNNGKVQFDIRWVFNKPFTQKRLDSYKENHNIEFKLQEIKRDLELTTSKENFFTFITYDKNKVYIIDKLLTSSIKTKADMFIYDYSFIADIDQTQSNDITIEFKDSSDYYLFHFNNENIIDKDKAPLTIIINYLSKIFQ